MKRHPLRPLLGHLMAVLLITASLTACKTTKNLLQRDNTTAATTTAIRKDSLTAQAITLTFDTPQKPTKWLQTILPDISTDTPPITAVTITTTTATSTKSAQATQTTHTQQQQKEQIPTTYKTIIILIFLTTLITCALSTPKK